ncbi:MAG: hypothetical protein JWN25_3142 [Verrucomicrobiales bacterium]|nr:hypothetical protein [Verrucomicrobiales bacterium]
MKETHLKSFKLKQAPFLFFIVLGLIWGVAVLEPAQGQPAVKSSESRSQTASPLKVLSYDLQYGQIGNKLLFGNSVFHLYFDQTSGMWEGLEIHTINVFTNAYRTVDFNIDGKSAWDTYSWKFKGSDVGLEPDRKSSRLRLSFEGYEKQPSGIATEPIYRFAVQFKVASDSPRLERSAELTLLKDKGTQGTHFEGFTFVLPEVSLGSPEQCQVVVPGPFDSRNYIPSPSSVSSLEGRDVSFLNAPEAGFGIMMVSTHVGGMTLGTWMDTGGEVDYASSLKVKAGKLTLRNHDNRFYLLRAGQTVFSDTHIVHVGVNGSDCLMTYREMVEKRMPVATNSPAWVKEAVILEAMPQYYLDGFKGLEARLAFYKDIGFNTLYLMPHWKGGYSPIDPMVVDPRLGKTNELKSLVVKAHELGMKVLFDMVIHGFDEKSTIPQDRPGMFIRDEKGELVTHPTWKSITPDWANRGYENYLFELVTHDVKEYGIDGYRVDAATFKGPNWDPTLPYPAYRAGSAAPDLLKNIIATLRESNSNAVLLSEVFGPLYHGSCDLVQDNMTMGPQVFLEQLSSNLVTASHYKEYLSDTSDLLPRGTKRVFFARNHDTSWFYHFNGYTRPFLALEAVHSFFGVPEVFAGDPKTKGKPSPDEGPEVWKYYKLLFEARRKYPELVFGNVQLRNIVSSNPNVIAGMRSYKGQSTLVIVSLSSKPEKVSVQLGGPEPMTMFFQQFKWVDALKSTSLNDKVDAKLNNITVEPYQVVLGR